MTTPIFKEDGSVDVDLLCDETKRMAAEKKAKEERKAIQEHISFLNETINEWEWFHSDRLIGVVVRIECLENRHHGNKKQKAIFDYLVQHEYLEYEDMGKEKFVSLITLLLQAMTTGKEKIAFDPEELEFYHVGDITPSEIAARKKVEEAQRYKGIKGWCLRLLEKLFS
jgi:hypothetical protein